MTGSKEPQPRRSARTTAVRVLSIAAVALTVALLSLGALFWLMFFGSQGDTTPGRFVQIEIVQGASTAQIAQTLADAGVVANARMFRLRVRLSGADEQLKAGVYDLVTGSPYSDVISKLQDGPDGRYSTVTIPEGFVIEQIAKRFEAAAGISSVEFTQLAKTGAAGFLGGHPYLSEVYQGSLEGYLFPKTYRVKASSTATDAIEMMLDQFDEEILRVDMSYPESKGMSLNEVVTVASMIEREAKIAQERELVSSVIYNRLDKGMLLEIDATIEYVLPGNRFRLRASDIRIKSPYNSYLNKGLPPGPIASPGLAALKAAARPAQTQYLYYVLTGKDGSHTFCVTCEEFLVAKKKSKEVFGQ